MGPVYPALPPRSTTRRDTLSSELAAIVERDREILERLAK